MRESNYFKRLEDIVYEKLYPRFRQAAINLIVDASNSKEHGDLTGNTITSFSAGIYKDGSLYDVINVMDVTGLDTPNYTKLSNDMGIVTIERYDNMDLVTVNTASMVSTDKKYGFDSARSFLLAYTPKYRKGWSLVVTTGTEYSEYIESVRKLNVLTETYLWSDKLLRGVF